VLLAVQGDHRSAICWARCLEPQRRIGSGAAQRRPNPFQPALPEQAASASARFGPPSADGALCAAHKALAGSHPRCWRAQSAGPPGPWPPPGRELLGRQPAVAAWPWGWRHRPARRAASIRYHQGTERPAHHHPDRRPVTPAGERAARTGHIAVGESPNAQAPLVTGRIAPQSASRLSPAPGAATCRVRAWHQRSPGPGRKPSGSALLAATSPRGFYRDRNPHRPASPPPRSAWDQLRIAQHAHCRRPCGELAHYGQPMLMSIRKGSTGGSARRAASSAIARRQVNPRFAPAIGPVRQLSPRISSPAMAALRACGVTISVTEGLRRPSA